MNYKIVCNSDGVIYTSPWMDLKTAQAKARSLCADGMDAWIENRAGKRIDV